MKRVIAYIDGFNLYFGLKDKGWKRYYWLNIQAMVKSLLPPGQSLVCTKYFTSRVKYPADKRTRQSTFLDALNTLSDFVIFYGRYQLSDQECYHCHRIFKIHNEKKSDVNLAVEMLTDAFQDRFDVAFLVSADADLSAPVSKVKALFPEKYIVVALPPERSSFELNSLASQVLPIGRAVLARSQFPDQVTTASGYVLQKPVEWK
jgi:hypothetical protein